MNEAVHTPILLFSGTKAAVTVERHATGLYSLRIDKRDGGEAERVILGSSMLQRAMARARQLAGGLPLAQSLLSPWPEVAR